jgi:hypothetical protein
MRASMKKNSVNEGWVGQSCEIVAREMQGRQLAISGHVRIGYEPTGSVHDDDNLGLGDVGEVHG